MSHQEKREMWSIWGLEGCKKHHCVVSNIRAHCGFYRGKRCVDYYSRGVGGTIVQGTTSVESWHQLVRVVGSSNDHFNVVNEHVLRFTGIVLFGVDISHWIVKLILSVN